MAEVAQVCLGRDFRNELEAPPARYDYRTKYAELYGGRDGYMYDREQVLADLGRYVAAARQGKAG